MAKKKVAKDSRKSDDSKLFAFIATFFSIVGFIIVLITRKEDRYVMYYARQSLVIFIVAFLAAVIGRVLSFIPILGWIIGAGLNILVIIVWVVSWIYALSGEEKEIPLVSEYAEKINI
jgi:uncharacterized membrane protein